MDNSAKILLLGKTGAGKSSFINYFLGKSIAETGDGKPVTPHLTAYEFRDGGYPITVFDTKGLEAKGANEQFNEIAEEVKKRNNSDDIFNWFHTIFYCVSMDDPRFQDYEAALINTLMNEICQHVHVIITHCDGQSEDALRGMRKRIIEKLENSDNIEFFEVVSVNEELADGTITEQRGREEVYDRVFNLFWEDIAYKLSFDYARSLRGAFVDVADKILFKVENMIDSSVKLKTLIDIIKNEDNLDDIADKLLEELEQDLNDTQEKTDRRFNKILQPAAQLYSSYKGEVMNSFAEDAQLAFGDWDVEEWTDVFGLLEADNTFMNKLFPKMAKKGYINEDGDIADVDDASVWEIIKMISAGVGDLMKLKKNLKKLCRDIHGEFLHSLPTVSELQTVVRERVVCYIDE